MAEQRLSNLQKWILVNCYEVTVLRNRKDKNLSRCTYYDKERCYNNVTAVDVHPNVYDCKTRGYEGVPRQCSAFEFTQNDIYQNYYKLEPSRRMAVFTDKVYYRHMEDSDKIYNSTTRSLKNLKDKKLIFYSHKGDSAMIVLTDAGREIAEKLRSGRNITAKC